jgi:hypothetical protein
MGFSGLSALLGLSGGANAVGGGLADLAATKRAEDQKRQQTALQLMLAGYQPAPSNVTPTAQGHPLAQNSYAHFGDPLLDAAGQGQALASLVAPRQMDVPGVGAFQETPGAALKRALGIQKQQADLAHTQRQITKPQLGDPNFAKLSGEVKGAEIAAETPALVGRAQALAPIHTQEAVTTAAGIAPIQQATHAVNRKTDLATEPTKVVGGMNAKGEPVFARVGQTGPATPIEGLSPKPSASALAAPMAAKVGQFGEMLKKAHDLTSLTDKLDVSVGQSATRDLAEHGIHIPLFGTVPGTKGLGSAMMGHSPEYSQYQAALSPFILAAAHALSGARINQDQVEQIRKSIELAPGDFTNKNVRVQKEKNLIDLINSIGGSLPKDAIAAQEAQMDEASLTGLTGRGYRRIGGATHSASGDPEFDALLAKHRRP